MRIEFDPKKSARNEAERLLPFERAAGFDWSDAAIISDDRNDYSEPRFIAIGYLDERLHILCFTPIQGGMRVISFRKANTREARTYGKPITINR
ncbi:MAG: BrnT family toxin [Syntrophobacteraceae bacterium]|nr:BrnT family toxin [Syntrophobacteraceae bacterium]